MIDSLLQIWPVYQLVFKTCFYVDIKCLVFIIDFPSLK
jgi:hypothetical protein